MQSISTLSTPWLNDKTSMLSQITLGRTGYQSKIEVQFFSEEITIKQFLRSNLKALFENALQKCNLPLDQNKHVIGHASIKISSPFTEEQKTLIKEILESQDTINLLRDLTVKNFPLSPLEAMMNNFCEHTTYDTHTLSSVFSDVKKCCRKLSKIPSYRELLMAMEEQLQRAFKENNTNLNATSEQINDTLNMIRQILADEEFDKNPVDYLSSQKNLIEILETFSEGSFEQLTAVSRTASTLF